MTLRHEPDVSHADWFARSTDPWDQLCSVGPSGFAAYARLFHPIDERDDQRVEDRLLDVEGDLEPGLLRRLAVLLGRHTSTPSDCFFGLWDGFGDLHGDTAMGTVSVAVVDGRPLSLRNPEVQPAFGREVLDGPRVRIPARDYLLFRGPLQDAGHWGAAPLWQGGPQRDLNSPNLIWPADRAWFVATEIDLPWTGVGGSAELIENLLTDDSLDTEPVEPSGHVPYGRTPE